MIANSGKIEADVWAIFASTKNPNEILTISLFVDHAGGIMIKVFPTCMLGNRLLSYLTTIRKQIAHSFMKSSIGLLSDLNSRINNLDYKLAQYDPRKYSITT